MTQVWLDAVHEKKVEVGVLSLRKREVEKELRALYAKCDHRHTDGTNAIMEGFMANVCMLCGWSDL